MFELIIKIAWHTLFLGTYGMRTLVEWLILRIQDNLSLLNAKIDMYTHCASGHKQIITQYNICFREILCPCVCPFA